MDSTGTRYRAKWSTEPPDLVRKAIGPDENSLTCKSLLTYPCVDLAGDFVQPDGCDFTIHKADGIIDLEHRRRRDVGGAPVAWAYPDFEKAEGPYGVEFKSLNFGTDAAPEWHTVPIGTEYYKSSSRVSMQIFAAREQGALSGSSLEFSPVPGFFDALGDSPLENRKAYHFHKARVHRWTVCERGVNPGAQTVTKSFSSEAEQVPGPLAKILADGRIKVGGIFETLCPVIAKALAPLAPAKSSRTVVRVESKAMPMPQPAAPAAPQQQAAAPADLDTANEEAVQDDQAPASGGVAAKYAFAQGIVDLCDQYEADMQSSDSPELRKQAEKFKSMAQKLAGMVKDAADKHDSKLNGGPDGDIETDDDESEEDADADDSDLEDDDEDDSDADDSDDKPAKGKGKPFGKALQRDDDGVIVTRRPVYRKSLFDQRVKRFSLGDLSAPPPKPVKKAKPEVKAEPSEDVTALNAKLDKLAQKLKFL